MWKFVDTKCPLCKAELAEEEPKDVAIARRKARCPKCGKSIPVTEVAGESESEPEPEPEPGTEESELEPEPEPKPEPEVPQEE